MLPSIKHISFLLFAVQHAVADTHHPQIPQRPISFSTPAQQPILSPTTYENLSYGTINIFDSISVTYRVSPNICTPLVPEIPYIIVDLTQRLRSNHRSGITFSGSAPVYVAANITEQIYRNKYILSLEIKLEPKQREVKDTGDKWWREVIEMVQESALVVDRDSREREGMGGGNLMVLEGKVEEIGVRAEWRAWEVADGEAVVCG